MTGDADKDAKAFAELNPAAAGVIRGEGAKAERTRIAQIHQLAEPGEDKLTAKFVEEGTDVATAALGFTAERKRLREAAAQARVEDTPKPITQAPAGEQKKDERPAAAKTDDELKADYAASTDLKAEFPTADAYVGYVRGSASGQIRQIKRA
jgi:hypothetical protein